VARNREKASDGNAQDDRVHINSLEYGTRFEDSFYQFQEHFTIYWICYHHEDDVGTNVGTTSAASTHRRSRSLLVMRLFYPLAGLYGFASFFLAKQKSPATESVTLLKTFLAA
jgi:hypothetical protein